MDIVATARDYLAHNAAESGADVLIAALVDEVEMARKKPLAQLLKDWRASRGISAIAAADLLGLPVRTLEGIEQGRPFRYEKMLRLALKAP